MLHLAKHQEKGVRLLHVASLEDFLANKEKSTLVCIHPGSKPGSILGRRRQQDQESLASECMEKTSTYQLVTISIDQLVEASSISASTGRTGLCRRGIMTAAAVCNFHAGQPQKNLPCLTRYKVTKSE